MGQLPAGLAAYLARKRQGSVSSTVTPSGPTPMSPNGYPMIPLHPQMVAAIKRAPKGKLPPGLAAYIAAHKKKKKLTKKQNSNITGV
jgi:hypothetical protein